MEYDPATVEADWRERWQDEGWYEVDPEGSPEDTTYVTVAYPYPNGAMHIGHVRTYTVPDVFARYRRMQGDQVLFPMAWHVTGTPIIGAVERLKKREAEQVRILTEVFGVPEEDFEALETPMGFARYFIENSYKRGMQLLGLSVDWRREFTTNDDSYREFISWQYETLLERDLLIEDTHPVNFCTNEEQPVTTHDLLEGEDAEFQQYTLVKFSYDDVVVPMATLRPETVRGVTNAFVDPKATYVRAAVDDETWVVSAEAAEKLRLQLHDVEVLEQLVGTDLVGEFVRNPVTGEELPILPATFVDADNATGVVMSVPAHSPDDWVALQSVKSDPESLIQHDIDRAIVDDIQPVAVLELEGYGEFPAKDAVEEHGIDSQGDPTLETATQELYNREYHAGRLNDAYGEFAGEVIEDVRDAFEAWGVEAGHFDAMYEYNEDVVCRCGGRVEVAEQDTWFLRYNDPDWREKTHRLLEGLEVLPATARDQYDHTIDWLEEWPCIRNYGLGTPLPWDQDFIIEPLSDSTIYMAYYTLAHRLAEVDGPVDRSFFEEVFNADDPEGEAAILREEFEHWYPVDVRFSANELIANHLTFYLYHHAELFDESNWPRGVTTMGMGLIKGQSMSSSAGRVALAPETVEEYGADTVRFFLLNSAQPWQDFDWRPDPVGDTHNQLSRFWRRSMELIDGPAGQADALEPIDEWLLGRLQRVIRTSTDALDRYETRTASQAAFYELEEDLKWYRRRTELDRPGAQWAQREVLRTRLLLLNPFIPFLTNELYERLTGEPAETQPWPTPNPDWESDSRDTGESYLESLVDDINAIVDVTGSNPEVLRIYTAAPWKEDALRTVLDADEPDHGRIMSTLMSEQQFRDRGDRVAPVVSQLVELVHERSGERLERILAIEEASVIDEARAFLAEEFDATVEIYGEDDDPVDPADRAKQALPGRPAIHLE